MPSAPFKIAIPDKVQRWTDMPSGGHFAVMEEPQALAEDIRAFIRPYRIQRGILSD
jgi:hypothetical protein